MDKKYFVVMKDKKTKLYASFFGSMLCWTDCKDAAHQFDAERSDQWIENLKESGNEDFYKEECKLNMENDPASNLSENEYAIFIRIICL